MKVTLKFKDKELALSNIKIFDTTSPKIVQMLNYRSYMLNAGKFAYKNIENFMDEVVSDPDYGQKDYPLTISISRDNDLADFLWDIFKIEDVNDAVVYLIHPTMDGGWYFNTLATPGYNKDKERNDIENADKVKEVETGVNYSKRRQ